MYQLVSNSDFHDAFRSRLPRDQFTHAGLNALFEHLEEYEDGSGMGLELDVIGLCCEYTEYADWKSYCKEHGLDSEEDKPDDIDAPWFWVDNEGGALITGEH